MKWYELFVETGREEQVKNIYIIQWSYLLLVFHKDS